ncbi:hypothetical protein ACFYM2_04995 [Streptomyces sp. NPDC006711]|uniref:hypothetical protein n=1 Tax=unclassified Streptomyces TaxID=2593676 RepID=UPI0033F9BF95
MADQLTSYVTLVMPDYGGFDLYDPDFDVRDSRLIPLAIKNFAAGNGYEITVDTAQSQFKVKLAIDTWTGAPPLPDGWAGHRDLRLELPTGLLVISERTRGAWDVTVPKGSHQARLSFRGREEARQLAQSSAPQDALTRYDGTEQYLLQLWPETRSHRPV